MSFRYFGLAGATTVVLASCQAATERADVRREWHTTLQELGVQPIYPPREDVQVGDIYLCQAEGALAAKDERALPLDLWLAQVDLKAAAADFYAKRSRFPDSPGAAEAGYGRPDDSGLPADQRLMQVAFPEFASMTVRGQDLEWLIPVEALAIAGGSSWQGGHEITLRIPSVESYGLPAKVVLDHLVVEESGELRLNPELGLSRARLQALREEQERSLRADGLGISDANGRADLHLEVIREVYFARAIDIAISRTSDFGPEADISLIDPEDGSDQDLIARLNERLARTLEHSTPGASVRVIGANDASVVLRRTFQRPIAVGYRSFVTTVEADSEIVAGIGAMTRDSTAALARTPSTKVGPALSNELSAWFKDQAEAIVATFEDDAWVLHVHSRGDSERAGYLFLTRADREQIAGKVRARSNGLDDASEEHLQIFVDGALSFVEG